MELGNLITWIIGLAVTVMVGAWGRVAAKINRNTEATAALRAEVAQLRARVGVLEAAGAELTTELRNVHARVGGVAATANKLAGEMTQLNNVFSIMHEHMLRRERERA